MDQWALCSKRSHGTKSAMLESKLSTGTSRTKRLHQDKFEFSLFWMSQWIVCSPAWWRLYHATVSCKGPIKVTTELKNARAPDQNDYKPRCLQRKCQSNVFDLLIEVEIFPFYVHRFFKLNLKLVAA